MGNSCGCCNPPSNNNSPCNPTHLVLDPSPSTPPPPPPPPRPPPSLESVIQSIKQSIGNETPTHNIDLLIKFIDNMLLKLKAPSDQEASSSSSAIPLESVTWGTRAASDIIGTISKEANELENSDAAKELGRVALKALKLVGESHWIFVGLSMAAYALERCVTMGSNVTECNELLEKIVHLAKDVKTLGETIPHDSERLRYAVQVIVEGTILCCDYVAQGKRQRYWLAPAIQAQLEKTGKSIQDITSSLTLSTVADMKRQLTRRIEQSPQKLLDFKPEGIEERVAQVKEMVDLEGSEAAVAIILWGFGGVGKSVLASTVIQELDCISKGFKFCMVIIDDKIEDKKSHIKQLQKDIINDFGGGKVYLRNTEEGRQQVQEIVRNKRCLLFIDNVVESFYIKELLPSEFLQVEENSCPGEEETSSVRATEEARLRIVITSRQNDIKQFLRIKKMCDYQVEAMSYHAARVILRKTILDESQVLNGDFDDEGCIDAIAEACKGIPLLLSVFGNYLRVERHQIVYEEALKALKEGEIDRFDDEGNLSEKLMFVYDKMRDQEAKEAFLDICTYFHGWSWESVGEVIDSSKLEILLKRGLIKRDESGKVIVHDILRLMGSKAAKETRIADFSEFSAVVEDEYKLRNVKGVTLMDNSCLANIESTHLNAMRHSLRVLRLGDWVLINGLCNGDFTNLRYLFLGDVAGFPFTDASKMEKLTRFHNRSKTCMDLRKLPRTLKAIQLQDPGCEELGTLQLENLKNLKRFTVTSSKPVKLPERFKLPASLERLGLLNCTVELRETFGYFTNIEVLNLSRSDFEYLPEGFGRLARLKKLYMEHCPSLKSLSDGFGSLCSLRQLSVQGCSCLENLPDDFGRLTALQQLWLGKCESLTTLSEDFGGLSSLEYLDIRGCISLKRLPESFSKLSIDSLDLESLISLDELPQSLGDMSSLTRLVLKSCNSLTNLPNSLVKLKMLVYLKIERCTKLARLPEEFGLLCSLTHLVVTDCPVLEELSDGLQALPVLKILELRRCRNLVNLSPGFGELNCLEQLYIESLPLSSLPKGFGNLKRLWKLWIWNGFKLETLPDGIENLVTLRTLGLVFCRILDGTAMEKILKLQNCSFVRIYRSDNLIEWWEEMQDKEKCPMLVSTRRQYPSIKDEDWQRASRVALFSVNCKALSGSNDELMDRSSIAINVDTTVAVISLPFQLKSHHEDHLKYLCDLAKKRSRTSCSGQLQIIVCLKGIELDKQRETEEQEDQVIRQALKWLPQGSGALPAADIRRRFLVKRVFFPSYSKKDKLLCFMADVRVQVKMTFQDSEIVGEDEISEKLKQSFQKSKSEEEQEKETTDELQECLKLLCDGGEEERERSAQIPHPEELNMFKLLAQALNSKGIHHFINPNMQEVHINDLEGKDLCFIICDPKILLYARVQQIYKDLQSLNFERVWIPLSNNDNHGIGTYIRTCRYMSLTTLLHPMITQGIKETNTHFIFLNKEGKIINRAPLSLVMSWEIEAFPFKKFEIEKIISKLNYMSALEFLLEDMDILDHEGIKMEKQLITKSLIFLYVEPPTHKPRMKDVFDQLLQVHTDFKILYIGHFSGLEEKNIEAYKKTYEAVTQKMHWLKLPFMDIIKFWCRCSYLSSNFIEKLNLPFTLSNLVKQLYVEKRWMLFLDSDGIVTTSGKDVVDLICQSTKRNRDEIDIMMKDELIKNSLGSGKCSRIVQTYFTTDEIYSHPQHQHLLSSIAKQSYTCDICYSSFKVESLYDQRWYICDDCDWGVCEDCWKLYARQKVKSMLKL